MKRVRRAGRAAWATGAPQRRELAPGELPGVAVMTMARDEGPMLRRWVAHYAAQVGAEHVVVVDDNSSDGSTDDLPCPVLRIPPLRKRGFEASRMHLLAGLSASLLEAYDAVVFCDADEFIVPDPRHHESLRHYVAARPDREAVGVLGLNVVHDTAREAPLRFDEPLLGQRRLATFLPLMCKPAVKWVPAPWAHASHGILCPFEIDPELWMFHMKFADRDRLATVAERRNSLNVSEGRAAGSSWSRGSDEMVALIDEVAATIPAHSWQIPRFAVPEENLGSFVRHENNMWRAVGAGQVQAMRNRRVHKIPSRFLGVV